jgi:hypothetical protein
MTTIR